MKKLNAILIIDDDPIYNFLTRKLIDKCNITDTVIVATNGIDALQKLSEFSPEENICPELILIDIEMPVMNGFEFIESFKEMSFVNKDQVALVAISSTIYPAYKEILKEKNIQFYLNKPLTTDSLIEVVSTFQTIRLYSELNAIHPDKEKSTLQ